MASYFVQGSEIRLFDGSVKNIEDVIIGDIVLSQGENMESHSSATVNFLDLSSFFKDDVRIVTLSNGKEIVSHVDSKFVTIGVGNKFVSDLEVGDICIDVDGTQSTVVSVSPIDAEHGLFEDSTCGLYSIEFENSGLFFYCETMLVSN